MAPKVTTVPKTVQSTINFRSTKPSAIQASKAKKETEIKAQPITTTPKPISPARPKRDLVTTTNDDDDKESEVEESDDEVEQRDDDDDVAPSTTDGALHSDIETQEEITIKPADHITISSSEEDELVPVEQVSKLKDLSRSKAFKQELQSSKQKVGKPVGKPLTLPRCNCLLMVLGGAESTKGEPDALTILRVFDDSYEYGPCVGIDRLERWERAEALGLDPPQVVRPLLLLLTLLLS